MREEKFKCIREDDHHVITLNKGLHRKPIIYSKKTDSKSMYNNGFQKNYKDLVSVEGLTSMLCELLNAYDALGILDKESYVDAVCAYEPILSKYVTFDIVEKFLSEVSG